MLIGLHILIQIALAIRVLLRPHRDSASRITWIVVIAALPVLGILAYLLVGETNIGRRRAQRQREALLRLMSVAREAEPQVAALRVDVPSRYAHLFELGHSINGFRPVGGNRARLMTDSNAAINAIVADIDAARHHVSLMFYIWLADNNGLKVVEALKRAAGRGVACRHR